MRGRLRLNSEGCARGLASVAALLLFVALGWAGLARVFERMPPKHNDALVGFVIAVVGVYVLLVG